MVNFTASIVARLLNDGFSLSLSFQRSRLTYSFGAFSLLVRAPSASEDLSTVSFELLADCVVVSVSGIGLVFEFTF